MNIQYWLVLSAESIVLNNLTLVSPVAGSEPADGVRVTSTEYIDHPPGSVWVPRPEPVWPDVVPPPDPEPEPPVPPVPLPVAANGVAAFEYVNDFENLQITLEDGRTLSVIVLDGGVETASLNSDGTLSLTDKRLRTVQATGNTNGVSSIGMGPVGSGVLRITRVDTSVVETYVPGADTVIVTSAVLPALGTLDADTIPLTDLVSAKWVVSVVDVTASKVVSMELLAINKFGVSVDYTTYALLGDMDIECDVSIVMDTGNMVLRVVNTANHAMSVSYNRIRVEK